MMFEHPTCPGLYCGRTLLDSGIWGDCGACPRGFRRNETSYCLECTDNPSLYDWLYLGFMTMLPLILHWFCIDLINGGRRNRWKEVITECCSAFLEVSIGALAALLFSFPRWTLTLQSCRPQALSDWYTLLHNPQPGYKETLHCTQEAIYPLYTIVLLMYGIELLLMVTLRPCLMRFFAQQTDSLSLYCALYVYPMLVLIHAVGAGLIYYAFPYIIIILSMMSSASHFSIKEEQSPYLLFKSSVTDLRNAMILLWHWVMHAYGIISITGFKEPLFHGMLLALVPAPAIFYVVTARFTDPMKIHNE